VARAHVGKKVRVKLLRDGKKVELIVTIGERKEEEVVASTTRRDALGLTVQRVTPQIAESLGLDRPEGVVITFVKPGSPADAAGFRSKDVILQIDRKPIRSLEDYRKAIAKIKKGKGTLFLAHRGDTTLFLPLKIPR
ncbi:MAG: PDZ domain-containing protein, partial [Nitrospiraceae bacterium]